MQFAVIRGWCIDEMTQRDVWLQYAIVIRTPAYRNTRIKQPVTVQFQLRRPSDGEASEPKPFQYIPEDPGECHFLWEDVVQDSVMFILFN